MRTGLRGFTILWVGQTVSLIGSALTSFALYVWVLQQTHSVTRYTLIAVVASLPAILLGPLTGVAVDRYDRRRVMLAADALSALTSLAVLALVLRGALRVWEVYPIVMVTTLLASLRVPAFSASITLLVPQRHYARAAGLRQSSEAGAAIVAPVVAGFLLAAIGLASVIAVDLITFLAGLASTLVVAIPRPPADSEHAAAGGSSWWRQAGYGWTYLHARRPLLRLLIYISLLNLLVGQAIILFAPLVLAFASSRALGAVLSLAGAGGLAGGLLVGITGGPRKRMLGIVGFALLAGPAMFVVGSTRLLPLIAAGAFTVAFGLPLINSSAQAIFQAKVAPEVQGRVFAFRRIVGQISSPITYLLAGPLADRVFEPLMMSRRPLALALARVTGAGNGRGIAVIFLLCGVATLLLGLCGLVSHRLNRLEDEVPDALQGGGAAGRGLESAAEVPLPIAGAADPAGGTADPAAGAA